MSVRRWRVSLTPRSKADFQDILAWTAEIFGIRQARTYEATLRAALRDLAAGPGHPLVRRICDVQSSAWRLHVGRTGPRRPALHRQADDTKTLVVVLRILHDAMDLERRVPATTRRLEMIDPC